MSIAWGDFDSMALHYIKLLADPKEKDPIWIQDGERGPYGVCEYWEFASLIEMQGEGKYRPVSTMSREEFMGLLLVRYRDFFPEEEDDVKKKDISTGELFGGEPSAVDAGGDRSSEGGRSEDSGGGKKEDIDRTVH